jgi:enoyl-CoA hydratase/carnithine racemase
MAASAPVLVERHGRRGELVLHRPERKNAVTGPLVEALLAGVEELQRDDRIGAILLRGAGDGFCAGLDTKELALDPPPPWREGFAERWVALHAALFECPKPLIGALQGFAIAAGSSLALACDLLVAGEGAFLQVSEARLDLAAPINVAWLQLKIGAAAAYELALLAERHDGADLVRRGLAVRVVPDARVLDEARDVADRVAELSPRSHAATKRVIAALSPFQSAREYFGSAQRAARLGR